MTSKKAKQLEEVLIQVGLRIAKRGEGALFVVGDVKYKVLVKQAVLPFNIIENPKLLETLALMDGAVIIKPDGMLEAYGAMIKSTSIFKNYGTRHSAAISAAKGDNFVLIISEEDRKLKILKKGKMILQIDALQRDVEKSVDKVVLTLESIGAGTIGFIGTSLLIPGLGITFLPGVVIFGSTYYLGKFLSQKLGIK